MEDESLRELMRSVVVEFDYFELSSSTISNNESEEIQVKTVTRGVFKQESSFLAIVCNFVNPENLKEGLRSIMNGQQEVKNVYRGEKYLLCLCDSKTYSFSISLYNELCELIDEVEDTIEIDFRKLYVSIDRSENHILVIRTNVASFLLAGLISGDQEEEERVILSNKLKSSQPFFAFKAPIEFDWENLLGDKDRQFERICELLLQNDSNIKTVIPIGKTRASDRGRDFEVIETLGGLSSSGERRWLVQCKFSINSISASSISGWTDRVIEHQYDGFWLMTNNDITPNLFDQFKDVENNEKYDIRTKFWQRSDFHIKLNVHSELFINGDIFSMKQED